jgi:hypothetical protein
VEFPAARYLARAERDHSRTLRMRNLLLMLLRMFAVFLLAAAAARPTARIAGAGHAPTALAIVLDNSLSTSVVEGGTPLLEQFKRMAREAIRQASPDDRVWLITADATVRGGSPGSLVDELERVRPYSGAGRIHEAVGRAVAAVEATGLPARQVAILTDAQRSTWNEPAQIRGDVPVLVWAPRSTAPINRAVVLAEPRPLRWTPRGALAARAIGPDSTTYRIALGPRTLARGTIVPNEEAVVRAAPAERGWTAGSVELEPDELRLDNTRYFALWIGSAPAVRVLPGAGVFARNAVDVLRSSERVAEGSSIVVAAADEVAALHALILPPSDPVRLGAANRALERLGVPWRYGPVRREASIARSDQIQGVSVTWRYQLLARGVPAAETLAVVGREPWIVSGPRYVLVGSPLAPEATSFPVSAAFLPWLGDMLASRLHADPGGVRTAVPGERIVAPPGVEALQSVDGARTPISGGQLEAPATAGTYYFIQGTRRVGALVVNAEVSESQLDRWPQGDLDERIVTTRARVANAPDDWVRQAFTGAAHRSLVVPLLAVTLLVLGVEAVAAAAGRRGQQ